MCYQVDFLAGDGNKACFIAYPSDTSSEVQMPTYTNSLLQFLLKRMINTATQHRKKHYKSDARPIRVRAIIAAPYEGLKKTQEKLEGINRNTNTIELAKETEGCGDCCSMRIIEWGHSLNSIEEDVSKFNDEDRVNAVGEYTISVNETVWLADNNVFNLAQGDEDSHNPLIVHCTPYDTAYSEVQSYKHPETKKRKAQNRISKGLPIVGLLSFGQWLG